MDRKIEKENTKSKKKSQKYGAGKDATERNVDIWRRMGIEKDEPSMKTETGTKQGITENIRNVIYY